MTFLFANGRYSFKQGPSMCNPGPLRLL